MSAINSLAAGAFAASLTGILTGRMWMAPVLAVVVMLRALATWATRRLAGRQARAVKAEVRARVMTLALSRRRGDVALGETTALAVDAVEALDGYVSSYRPAEIEARIGPLLIAVMAALASPIAALILLATLVPFVALMALAGSAAAQASRRQLEALSRLSGLFVDRVRALPVILAFQAEAAETGRVAGAAREVSARTIAVLRIAFLSTAALEFFAALSIALAAVYCGFSLLRLLPFKPPEHLAFARAFFVLALAPEFYGPMRRLAGAYHQKQLGEAAIERLKAGLANAAQSERRPVALSAPPEIRFEGVMLRFADVAIGPIDAVAPAGRITAIVGETGSGKTSLLAALLDPGLPSGGAIEVDGRPLCAEDDIGGGVSWAGQAPAFLPGTVLDNLKAAAPHASDAQALQAALDAGLGPALSRRTGGHGLVLGERGSGLSGGERRRLALARALLRPAPLLLLDEPTADLDPKAEAEVITLLRQAAAGRTVLVATHSPALAAAADHRVQLP